MWTEKIRYENRGERKTDRDRDRNKVTERVSANWSMKGILFKQRKTTTV